MIIVGGRMEKQHSKENSKMSVCVSVASDDFYWRQHSKENSKILFPEKRGLGWFGEDNIQKKIVSERVVEHVEFGDEPSANNIQKKIVSGC